MSIITTLSAIPGPLRRRIAMVKAYKNVFESPDGRMVLRDLIDFAGLFEAEPGSVEITNFRLGSRAAVLHILDAIKYDETALMALAAERLDADGQQDYTNQP